MNGVELMINYIPQLVYNRVGLLDVVEGKILSAANISFIR